MHGQARRTWGRVLTLKEKRGYAFTRFIGMHDSLGSNLVSDCEAYHGTTCLLEKRTLTSLAMVCEPKIKGYRFECSPASLLVYKPTGWNIR